MKKEDKHTWIEDKDFKDDTFKSLHVCIICKCKKFTDKYKTIIYSRSKIMLTERPNCVDWNNREDLNHIDHD